MRVSGTTVFVSMLLIALLTVSLLRRQTNPIISIFPSTKDLSTASSSAPDFPSLFITAAPVGSGLGSIMSQSLVVARLAEVLGSHTMFHKIHAEHGYNLETSFNPARSFNIDTSGSICRIDGGLVRQTWESGVLACPSEFARAEDSFENLQTSRRKLADQLGLRGCSVVTVDVPIMLAYELQPCMCDWLKATKLSTGVTMRQSVLAIHVRWGDLAPGQPFAQERYSVRTFEWAEINAAVRGLQSRYNIDLIELYMESPPEEYLSNLDFPYTVVNSGTDEEDLRSLASAEYKILSGSDYGSLAAMMAQSGVIVAKDQGTPRYKWNLYSDVIFIPLTELTA